MTSSSEKQRNYIFYLRNKYGSKEKAPEKYKWAFEKGWETIKEDITDSTTKLFNDIINFENVIAESTL